MSYIGNQPTSIAFQTDTFSGTGSTTAFTMSVAPANTTSVIVAITGVLQDPSTYSVSGTTLTFSAAPPSGTSNISVRYLGIPASGVTTTAYRTVTNFTATAGQTSFSTPSYTVGYIDVFRNGVRLVSTDFTATTGTTVVLTNACTVGDSVVTESFYVSSVLNALPTTGGTLSGNLVVNGDETISGNVGIGTTSPSYKLDVQGTVSGGTVVQRILNLGTATSTQAIFQLATGSASDRYVNYTVNYSSQYLQTAGSNITTSYTDFDTQFFRNNAGTVRASIDSTGNFAFNSGYGSAATAYGCRAWVNFNGVTTATIRASGNVTSVTRNGAGDYTVNFTTAMPDANYSVNAIAMLNGTNSSSNAAFTTVFGSATYGNAYTTTSIRLLTQDYVSIAKDVLALNVAIFR